jgi:hypothetical protein
VKKKIESTNILKIAVLIFCVVNMIALFVMIREEAQAKSNAKAISYDIPAEETETEQEENLSPSPVLTLNESLIPTLSQDDLYNLKDVLVNAQALHAEDGSGNDITSQIEYSLTPVDGEPGTFDADFTVRNDYRRSAGASVTVSTELTSPFLMLTEDSVVVAAYSDFSISPYIKIAMDVDGDDLTEYVTTDDYVNTSSSGTYNISIYVYSRETDTMTRKNLTVTVQ